MFLPCSFSGFRHTKIYNCHCANRPLAKCPLFKVLNISLFYLQVSIIEFQEGWAVPEEDNFLMALHIEATNGSRQICSEAKSENLWLNISDPSPELILDSCDWTICVEWKALRYFGNSFYKVIYGFNHFYYNEHICIEK